MSLYSRRSALALLFAAAPAAAVRPADRRRHPCRRLAAAPRRRQHRCKLPGGDAPRIPCQILRRRPQRARADRQRVLRRAGKQRQPRRQWRGRLDRGRRDRRRARAAAGVQYPGDRLLPRCRRLRGAHTSEQSGAQFCAELAASVRDVKPERTNPLRVLALGSGVIGHEINLRGVAQALGGPFEFRRVSPAGSMAAWRPGAR